MSAVVACVCFFFGTDPWHPGGRQADIHECKCELVGETDIERTCRYFCHKLQWHPYLRGCIRAVRISDEFSAGLGQCLSLHVVGWSVPLCRLASFHRWRAAPVQLLSEISYRQKYNGPHVNVEPSSNRLLFGVCVHPFQKQKQGAAHSLLI